MNERISVVAFDLNETLVKWREAFDESFKETIREWVGRWSENDDTDVAVKTLQSYHRQRSNWIKKQRTRPAASQRHAWLKEAVKDLPLPSSETSTAAMMNEILKRQPSHARMTKGAKEALANLAKQHRIVIISDTKREKALRIVEQSGLKQFVPDSHVFSPPASGRRKPDTSRFEAVTRKLGVPANRCVMVGDSWNRDIDGALRAGWRAVWLTSSRKKTASRRLFGGKPVVQIGTLSELSRLLR